MKSANTTPTPAASKNCTVGRCKIRPFIRKKSGCKSHKYNPPASAQPNEHNGHIKPCKL